MKEYLRCRLCARSCGINRTLNTAKCGMPADLYVSRAALHMWEEPIISGTRGSGTIFFSGCSLRCIYCQNREISRGISGLKISNDRLAEIMLELQAKGAHNINLVTPTHYVPSIREAISSARKSGLSLPIVYNTASYDSVDTIRSLAGLVDVYLPDMKYYRSATASRFSDASDYPIVAKNAIFEMVRQVGAPVVGADGTLSRGVVVRVLLLPSHLAEAKLNVKYLREAYGDSIYISLMNQYTPPSGMAPPLNRRVTRSEYEQLCEYADKIGVHLGFTQEQGTADESFIPPFDNTGVL